MKSNFFFATVAAAVIFTSCAEKQILEPVSLDAENNISQATYPSEGSTSENQGELGQNSSDDLKAFSTEEQADYPQGAYLIEEVFIFGDREIIGRSLIISDESGLWIRKDDGTFVVNLQYAAAKLKDLEEVDVPIKETREIRVTAYKQEEGNTGEGPSRDVSDYEHTYETYTADGGHTTGNGLGAGSN